MLASLKSLGFDKTTWKRVAEVKEKDAAIEKLADKANAKKTRVCNKSTVPKDCKVSSEAALACDYAVAHPYDNDKVNKCITIYEEAKRVAPDDDEFAEVVDEAITVVDLDGNNRTLEEIEDDAELGFDDPSVYDHEMFEPDEGEDDIYGNDQFESIYNITVHKGSSITQSTYFFSRLKDDELLRLQSGGKIEINGTTAKIGPYLTPEERKADFGKLFEGNYYKSAGMWMSKNTTQENTLSGLDDAWVFERKQKVSVADKSTQSALRRKRTGGKTRRRKRKSVRKMDCVVFSFLPRSPRTITKKRRRNRKTRKGRKIK
jgi:hypothetical protein